MASTKGVFPDLTKGTFVDLLKAELSKRKAVLSVDIGTWTDSGETAAGDVYNKTIGVFVHNFGADALTKLNADKLVSDYVLRVIAAIGSRATDLAEGGEVDGWHVRAAAKAVIKKFRSKCPTPISKGTFEREGRGKWAHGDLCRDFETREEE